MNVGLYIYPVYAILRPTGTYTLVATFDNLSEANAFEVANRTKYAEIRIHERRRCLNAPVTVLENDDGVLIITPELEATCVRG